MRARFVCYLPLLLSVATCSGSTQDDTRVDPCTEAAQQVCARVSECSPFWFGALWDSDAACQADQHARCGAEWNAAATGLDTAHVRACAQARSQSCELLVTTELALASLVNGLPYMPRECRAPAGELPTGAPCTFDSQCQESLCRNDGGCLRCVSGLGEGATCAVPAGGALTCAAGLDCIAGICTRVRYAGEPCNTNAECEGPLVCEAGVCAIEAIAAAAPGTPCTSASDCALMTGVVCGTPSATCEQLVLSAEGLPCSQALICRAGLACQAGVCSPSALACSQGSDCASELCRFRSCTEPTAPPTCP